MIFENNTEHASTVIWPVHYVHCMNKVFMWEHFNVKCITVKLFFNLIKGNGKKLTDHAPLHWNTQYRSLI